MSSLQPHDMTLEVVSLKKAALVFRAINHNLRRQIIQLLHQHARMTVTQIYVKLRLEQSVASQHLAILRNAGLVIDERQGKYIFYSVNYPRLKQVQELAGLMIK